MRLLSLLRLDALSLSVGESCGMHMLEITNRAGADWGVHVLGGGFISPGSIQCRLKLLLSPEECYSLMHFSQGGSVP